MMNVKMMIPFIEAAAEVIKAECSLEVTRGNLALQKSALTADDITVLISLIGQVQGVVLYGLSTEAGLSLVSRMMGQEFDALDTLAQSGIAELGNVITGRASIKLSEAGYNCNISPPALILGKSITISTLDFSRIVVPLNTSLGEIVVHLALRDNLSAPASGVTPGTGALGAPR